MAWYQRNPIYDRSRLLRRAAGAQTKGRRKKAIELYRKVLAVEPNDAQVHRKIAPLLAETKQRPAEAEESSAETDTIPDPGEADATN